MVDEEGNVFNNRDHRETRNSIKKSPVPCSSLASSVTSVVEIVSFIYSVLCG